MADITNFNWPTNEPIEAERIKSYFELFLGRGPSSDTELNTTLYIARKFPKPRLETFRNLVQKPDFFRNNREMLPLVFDLMLRGRIFGGYMPPKTNVFCVGAARCGTTTLSVILGNHSNIYITPVKETNFFSNFATNVVDGGFDDSVYQFYFSGWSGEPFIGDFSPNYLRNRHAMDGIHNYNSEAKIIICVRDPVERAISSYFYTKDVHKSDNLYSYFADGIIKLEKNPEETGPWFTAQTALRQGLYCSDISYTKAKFKDVLIVEFREFADVPSLYNKLCQFIGIGAEPIDEFLRRNQKINASNKSLDGDLDKTRALLREFYRNELVDLSQVHGLELHSAG